MTCSSALVHAFILRGRSSALPLPGDGGLGEGNLGSGGERRRVFGLEAQRAGKAVLDLVPRLPLDEELGGQQLEDVVPHFVIADQQTAAPRLGRRIHPVPAEFRRRVAAQFQFIRQRYSRHLKA